jgi:hypothetical protein
MGMIAQASSSVMPPKTSGAVDLRGGSDTG